VRCATVQDVQQTLAFARTHQLPLVPRCGGHGYAGYSTSEGGIVLELGQMNSITLGEGTAVVGAGAKLVEVYDQLTAEGVAIPAGSCLSVGIAGLTQGGGIGIVDRAWSWLMAVWSVVMPVTTPIYSGLCVAVVAAILVS
jgi:FAD/FMN-containing dehydrogenase